jgi:hypothetical protein
MYRGRTLVLAVVAIAATSLAGIALAVMTLSGMGGAEGGDMMVTSTPPACTVLLLIGGLVLLELELAHRAGRRSGRRIRIAARVPLRAWTP